MKEALFYTKLDEQTVRCDLCPWFCVLRPGQTGVCKVRGNADGKLLTAVYNKVAAMGIDPIEKKPLYHFYPGKQILSIGEVGCNLQCSFCQNHDISQCYADEFPGFHPIKSDELIKKALNTPENIGIAYTYNEPFTFYEFMIDTARMAHEKDLKNVVVSNGYVNPEPLKQALPYIDAMNIDLKAFNRDFYIRQTRGKLEPVLESLKIVAHSNVHLEITNLVIPGLNDDEKEFMRMVDWIAAELGTDVPLHLSRYFPQYKMNEKPTPMEKLLTLFDIAQKKLHYVYLGNVGDEDTSSTFCPKCGDMLIQRSRYHARVVQPGFEGECRACHTKTGIVSES